MKSLMWCVLALAATVSTGAQAADKSKIAVFDVQEAIMGTNIARDKMKAFESRSDIAKMIKDADKLKKDIMELGKTASKDADKRKEIEFKQADFELIVRKLNSEKQAAGKSLIEEVAPKLEGVVKQIIDAEGIVLLLDKKAAIHADPDLDITAKVTAKLNSGK